MALLSERKGGHFGAGSKTKLLTLHSDGLLAAGKVCLHQSNYLDSELVSTAAPKIKRCLSIPKKLCKVLGSVSGSENTKDVK